MCRVVLATGGQPNSAVWSVCVRVCMCVCVCVCEGVCVSACHRVPRVPCYVPMTCISRRDNTSISRHGQPLCPPLISACPSLRTNPLYGRINTPCHQPYRIRNYYHLPLLSLNAPLPDYRSPNFRSKSERPEVG